MDRKCIICKRRNNCLTYNLGGLHDGERCNKFIEEPDITEEEQELKQQEQAKKKSFIEKLFEKLKHR